MFFHLALLSDSPTPLQPVCKPLELLHTNKPNSAGFPEATGWTAKEGTKV